MKTFDFAYWLDSLDLKKEPDQPPSDRLIVKAPSLLHAFHDGMSEATMAIIRQTEDHEKQPRIIKVEILEL